MKLDRKIGLLISVDICTNAKVVMEISIWIITFVVCFQMCYTVCFH